MDQLRAMRTFLAVAEAGSLTATARQLSEPLTTVSRRLAALEAHVGASLIARSTRRMALTDAGRAYLETCRRVIEELDGAESQLAANDGPPTGEIAITAPVVFGRLHLLPIIVDYLTRNSGVAARLLLVDRIVDMTEEAIDVALRIGPLPDSSLIARKVGALSLLTCAAPGYLGKHGVIAAPADLAAHACISFPTLSGGRWQFNSRAHGRRVVRIAPRLSVNTAEAAIDAAVAGLGVTRVLSYQADAALKSRKLKTVLDAFDDTEVPVHLVHRAVRLPRPQVRHFMDFAAGRLRARLPRGRSAA